MATILLADDDAAIRDLVKRALEQDGHKVVVTQDGAEALDLLQAEGASFDVLVSDIDMPALDGISLADAALKAHAKLHVVLMSGFTGQLEKAQRLDRQRTQAISKPFTLDQIKQTVRAALT